MPHIPARTSLAAAALLALAAGTLTPWQARADSAYFIGNSLTLDCCGAGAIAAFAGQVGIALTQGEHVRLGAALDYIATHPEDSIGAREQNWDQRLAAAAWDTLVVEPYPSPTSTLGSDLVAIGSFVDAARRHGSGTPTLVIFGAWPSQHTYATAGNFDAYWRQPVNDELAQPTVLAHAYFLHLRDRLAAVHGSGVTIKLALAGDAFAEVDRRIRGGAFAPISEVGAFYRDDNHLSDAGRYLAGATLFAALYGRDPTPLSPPATYTQNYAGQALTPELAPQLAAIAATTALPPAPAAPSPRTAAGGGGAADGTLLLLAIVPLLRARHGAAAAAAARIPSMSRC